MIKLACTLALGDMLWRQGDSEVTVCRESMACTVVLL